jgi:hypothetical protein
MNFAKERMFIRGQAHRVLRTVGHDGTCSRVNAEETHAIAYYVIKSVLFDHFEDFLKLSRLSGYVLVDAKAFVDFASRIVDGVSDWSTYGLEEFKLLKARGDSMRMTCLELKSI